MVDVFISYARAERGLVEPFKTRLETLGLDVFFDLEGIDGGAVFPDVITSALDHSKAVLTFWSPLYFARPWCLIEAREGMSKEALVPIRIKAFVRTAPPADLRHINYYDLVDWDGEDTHENWNRTLQRLGRLLGRDIAPSEKKEFLGGSKGAEQLRQVAPEPQPKSNVLDELNAAWANFPIPENTTSVELFLKKVQAAAPGSDLETEVERHLDEMRGVVKAEQNEHWKPLDEELRYARGTKKAIANLLGKLDADGSPAEGQAEERERIKEWELWAERLGPEAAYAALAAKAGKPVAERLFPVRLERVSGWPTPPMVVIPPGRFLMGAPEGEKPSQDSERPQHEVLIDYPFALGRHTVTFAEWDAALADGAKLAKPDDEGWGRANRPVINVSWEDAQAYLDWLNGRLGLEGRQDAYRLPSEAEWEYACRANSLTPFTFGNTITPANANYRGECIQERYDGGPARRFHQKTVQVGSYPPNLFGLYDMHGNVWEWCKDHWHDDYQSAPVDGSAWEEEIYQRRIVRGGGWDSYGDNLRSAFREAYIPENKTERLGFRVARTL